MWLSCPLAIEAGLRTAHPRISLPMAKLKVSPLCSNNGVPLEPTFTSLPADIKLAISEKLTDGEDLARMECTSKEMRSLVGENDGELWKPKYGALCARPFRIASEAGSSTGMTSWKDRYVEARQLSQCRSWITPRFLLGATLNSAWCRPIRRPIYTVDEFMIKTVDIWLYYDHELKMKLEDSRPDVVAGRKKSTHGRPRKDDRKRHGRAGAIHSPSSRYRWNHR